MAKSAYLCNKQLDAEARNTSFAVAQTYVQLHTGDPGAAGTSNVATLSARKAITFGSGANAKSIASTADITWTTGFANETITHFSTWDAETNGNCLRTGSLTASITTTTTASEVKIAAGSLTLTET